MRKDLCFVLIPLHDPFLSIFEENIKPVAAKCGLTAIKADDIYSNKPIMEDVWTYLNQARIVIADLTDFNPNVFYELGIAHTLGREVIMISQYSAKPPFDVGHVRYINYVYPSRVEQFETALERTIKQVLKDSKAEIRIVEEGRKESGNKIPTTADVRAQRLSSLTEWAGKWMTKHYKGLIHLGERTYNPYEIFERANNAIRTEAAKRWGSSSSTAKNYADTVMLTIEPEFEKTLEDEIAKEKASRIGSEQDYPRTTPLREVWSLWGRYSYDEEKKNPAYALKNIVEHFVSERKLTAEQVNRAIQDLVQMGAIYEVDPNVFKQVEGWSPYG